MKKIKALEFHKATPIWFVVFLLFIGVGSGVSIGLAINNHRAEKENNRIEHSEERLFVTDTDVRSDTDCRLDNLEAKVWMLENTQLYNIGDSVICRVNTYIFGRNKPKGVIVKVKNEYPYTWRYTVFDGVDLFGIKQGDIISKIK